MAKTLMAFFSRTVENYFGGSMRYIEFGNTEVVARKIKDMIGADLFKNEMKTPYAKDYNTCIAEAKEHQKQDARPELKFLPTSIDVYDTVILGYPNYWGTMPMTVFTFLEAFDFSGKTILPLCTNEGSGMGSSESDIRKLCSRARIKKGLPLHGSSVDRADTQIEGWLKSNGLM